MRVNFDLSAVKTRLGDERYDQVTATLQTRHLPENEKKMHLVTYTLIWASIPVGLGSIDENNIDEWCFRMAFLERLNGATFTFRAEDPMSITRKDIENHIGLRTNASTKKRATWVRRIVDGEAHHIRLAATGPSAGERIDAIDAKLLAKK